MSVIGNILWFIFAGFWQGVSWCLVGLVWCITIVGIPVGTQCFKMAGLTFFPFGKEVEYGGGAGSAILNVLSCSAACSWRSRRCSTACCCASPSSASPSACNASNRRSLPCCPSAP